MDTYWHDVCLRRYLRKEISRAELMKLLYNC